MRFSPEETWSCRQLVAMALAEDLGSAGDLTSLAIIPPDLRAETRFTARAPGVVAGLEAAALVAEAVDSALRFEARVTDGARIRPGDTLALLSGPMRGILAAERTALNFLQHLSGIASLTRRYVDAVAGLPCQILDTRKTIPGWRLLAKYAVRCGGGFNHRLGLYDGILVKDNHLAALASGRRAGEAEALRELRRAGEGCAAFVEIEVESLDRLQEMLPYGPDIVLLDNMSPGQMREAVAIRNRQAPAVLLEASGGIDLNTVRAVAETGVDRLSVGALTHSAPALDIALDFGA
jgi:nicotinate-nucleotide pyrophosphorylase (carboxylating)